MPEILTRNNLPSIVIGLVTFISTFASTFALYGYRITALENENNQFKSQIVQMYEVKESVAVLKANSESIKEDVADIKDDLRIIKSAFKIPN